MHQTAYLYGQPSDGIDPIVPLKTGGCDGLANMPWHTIDAAKANDP
jgi:hypothetical protein